MSSLRRKYPRWLQWIIKLLLIFLALTVIYQRIEPHSYQGIFSFSWHKPTLYIPAFLVLWLINLILDARIWQQVHAMLGKISIFKALETNLVCYTLSFITPVNSGELVGRYILLDRMLDRRKSLFLTFWSHFPRLIVKIMMGVASLFFLLKGRTSLNINLVLILLVVTAVTLFAYFSFIRLQKWLASLGWRRISFDNYVLKDRPQFMIKLRLLTLASLKFFTYNLQFLVILMLWTGIPSDPSLLASVIAMYAIGAFLPTLPAADFVIKAGVAMFVFETGVVQESMLLNAALITWLFNLALPSIAGGVIILKTDLKETIRRRPLPDSPHDL